MGLQRATDPIAEEFVPGAWLHYNPRRLHLGRIALIAPDGDAVTHPESISDVRTELDLWTGRIDARYRFDGHAVRVTTVADPEEGIVAVRIESEALAEGLAVGWLFDAQPDPLAWFESPLDVSTEWTEPAEGNAVALRTVESTAYTVGVRSSGSLVQTGDGDGVVARAGGDRVLEVVVGFVDGDGSGGVGSAGFGSGAAGTDFSTVAARAAAWWERYWMEGAAVSLEGSSAEGAVELERRIVLSQYLTAVNSAGSTPPAETGLTYNTWTGKFHLEMHWWHAAHFPMWGRGALLERSLAWYHGALDAARGTARLQGFRGARWPKQTDSTARESPSNIGVFLVWQQPHIIHLLELLHQEGRPASFLEEHYPLVEATADFMADFALEGDEGYGLPAPIIPAQESYLVDRATSADPTFELAYWSWALGVARRWRERLGLPRRDDWERVETGMRRPHVLHDGTYAALATPPYLIRRDHPSMLMALGWLPRTPIIDDRIMAATLDSVWAEWELQTSWGWDYPVMAMTASALGDQRRALDALLLPSPKNEYLTNGHNPQIPGFLSLYLPANGGLLAAVAHIVMAAERGAPLPDGWQLTAEGFGALDRLHHPSI